jgi:hypothetical protein
MVYNRDQIVQRALASTTNEPGGCYKWTRTMVGSASVGDVDRDGDADAVDGYKATKHKHLDRNPPAGVPVFWSGGSHGYGHAAVSLGGGKIRSTDAGGRGKVATVDLGWVERSWGLHYLGWTDDLHGEVIPEVPRKTPVAKPAPKATRVSKARDLLRAALAQATRKGRKQRADSIGSMLDEGPKR